ncbi:MAG: hypothetical protein HY549_01190 [Elusimicrobia bacterium]|nr:hypothetical protein [Elusimicrobiota bacterium]
MPEQRIVIQEDKDVVVAWKSGLARARDLGFGPFKQACLSGAVLELSRGVVEKGRQGVCVLSDESDVRMLRARLVLEAGGRDLAPYARLKLEREVNIGPQLPPVRLQQIVESCQVESGADWTRVTLTVNQSRLASKPSRASAFIRT